MSFPKQVDYIIVGQGLAGSAVALQAMKRNKKVLVIDQPGQNTSSRIAAGLFNPVTGKKMTKTWMADIIFPFLFNFYADAEKITGCNFFHPLPLYRPFVSVEEQNEWMGKSSDPAYAAYIEKIYTTALCNIKYMFGGLLLKQCGYLDTKAYTKAVQKHIELHGFFLDELFSDAQLTVISEGVVYKGCKADKIIFCQGEFANNNTLFSWLPIRPLKGETLKIKSNHESNQIINRGVYMVPAELGLWRVGSTYNFHDNTREITNAARLEMEQKLNDLSALPYEVINQEWGMRPTTPDRRPIIGAHPVHTSVIVFNGMGTKGVSLTPYFSDVLFRWFENETDLNKEVDVNRYKSLYSKFTK